MDGQKHSKTRLDRWALALVALAIAARVAAIVVLQSHTVPRSTYEHGEIAANLLAGRGFSIELLGGNGPTSQQAPVYPALLALAYAAFGVETPTALLAMQLTQALLGGLLVRGVMRLATLWLPGHPWAARFAGLLIALHPTQVYAATHIQVAALATTLLVWLFVLAERASQARSGLLPPRGGGSGWGAFGNDHHRDLIATGLVFALLVLTDPILVLTAPALAWILLRKIPMGGRGLDVFGQTPGRKTLARLQRLALVTLTAALTLTPWLVRNALVHGEFVFVKSTFGYAFWQGNCALSEGTDKVVRPSVETTLDQAQNTPLADANRALWAARHEAGYIDDIALTPEDKQALGRLSEPERSRVLFRRALDDLRRDPTRYPMLCLRRLGAFLLFDETNPKTRHPLYRAGHLGLTLLALLGLIAADGPTRNRLAPSLLTTALLTLFHALTIASARFHIPIEPLCAIWAGALATTVRGDLAFQPRWLTVS